MINSKKLRDRMLSASPIKGTKVDIFDDGNSTSFQWVFKDKKGTSRYVNKFISASEEARAIVQGNLDDVIESRIKSAEKSLIEASANLKF
jgi:hypothetical protein